MQQKIDQEKEKMKAQEQAYAHALNDELHLRGDILEIGFGLGYVAQKLQSIPLKSLTLIEKNPEVIQKAKTWISQQKNVTFIEKSWEEALPTLQVFDSVFFNDFFYQERDKTKNFNLQQKSKTDFQDKELLDTLKNQYSLIDKKFSDQEIDEFYQKIGKFNLQALPAFFEGLKEKKCISDLQYNQMIKKYAQDKQALPKQIEEKFLSPLLSFLEKSINKNMRKGSRIFSISEDLTSKYEDREFFEKVIENPQLKYKEQIISFQPNENFSQESFLMMVIEKLN